MLYCKIIRVWLRDLDGILVKGKIWVEVRWVVEKEVVVFGS